MGCNGMVSGRTVEEETVRKCFRKAGVLNSDIAVVECDEEDPFAEADEYVALQNFIDKTTSENEACPLTECEWR